MSATWYPNPNVAEGDYSTIAGGTQNHARGTYDAIGGGFLNKAGQASNPQSGPPYTAATVGGGIDNDASGFAATIGGGRQNVASAESAAVGGGSYNHAEASFATIAGGGPSDTANPSLTNNRIFDEYGSIGGGGDNRAGSDDADSTNAAYTTVSGGHDNWAGGQRATIGGGESNLALGEWATVAGGSENQATGRYGAVGGGQFNIAFGSSAIIGGGQWNDASESEANVGGGWHNSAWGPRSTVGGGYLNEASGNAATVPGGAENVASGGYSFAAGAQARATHAGSFVWSSDTTTESWGNNTFTARAPGGFRFYFDAGNGYCQLSGTNNWQCSSGSDRDTKTDVVSVDSSEVLERLSQVPIQTWTYRAIPRVRHIGPMAQDFSAAFGVGEDDKHINTVDADGVALAAIQGLYRLLQDKDRQIAALEARMAALEAEKR